METSIALSRAGVSSVLEPGDSGYADAVAGFDLSAVNHAPAFFDLKKLEWMNKEYLPATAGPLR